MHIKIYFDTKPIFLCTALTPELSEIVHHPNAVFIDEFSANALKSLLHEIIKPQFNAGVVLHTNLNELKKAFFKNFTQIEAAGGIVENKNHQLLFIERLGKWDLPKGKIEKGEKEEDAACREIEEETGAKNLTLKNKIGETYHTYTAFGKNFIKTTHWFYLISKDEQQLTPQTEENITALQWVNKNEMSTQLNNTYPSIRDILTSFYKS